MTQRNTLGEGWDRSGNENNAANCYGNDSGSGGSSAPKAIDSWMFRLVGGVFAVIGAVFLIVAIVNEINYSKAVPVTAEVIDVVSRTSLDDDLDEVTSYYPVYRYSYKGETYTITPNESYGDDPKAGDVKNIRISAKNPEKIVGWGLSLIFGFMGSIFFFLGTLFLIFTRK